MAQLRQQQGGNSAAGGVPGGAEGGPSDDQKQQGISALFIFTFIPHTELTLLQQLQQMRAPRY